MLEHTAGKFPLWLAPTQAIILPVSEKFHNYAENILQLLKNCEIRSLIDDRSEKIGKKIRDAELQRIPYMLIVGEKEENNNTVSVRKQGQGDMGSFKVQEFVDAVEIEVQNFK
jgi:threonyl-tRNA synthetase